MRRARGWWIIGLSVLAGFLAAFHSGPGQAAPARPEAVPAGAPARAAADPILSMLPEAPLMMIRVDNPARFSEAVRQTRIGEEVEGSPGLSAALDLVKDLSRLCAAIFMDLPDAVLGRLSGREAALVGFGSAGATDEKPPFALAVYLGGDAQLVKDAFEQKMLPRLQQTGRAVSVSTEQLPGGIVTVLNKGPKELCVRFVGDLVTAGSREAVLKFSPTGSAPAWIGPQEAPTGIASAYLNLEPLWARAMARAAQGSEQRQGLQTLGLPAVTSIWSSTTVEEGSFKDEFVAQMGRGAKGLLPGLMALKPGESQCASVVPADYAMIVSLQVESGEKLYGLVEETIKETGGETGLQRFRAGMAQIDQAFAVNLEWEVLPRIGREAFLALRAPAPDMAADRQPGRTDLVQIFGFAVNDIASLKGVFQRFAASPQAAQMGWQLMTEGFDGQDVYTLRNIAGPARLCMAFVGDFLVCSRQPEALRSVISAAGAGKTLANDAQYQATRKHLPPQAAVCAYLDSRPFRPLALSALRSGIGTKAPAFLSLLEGAVPDLGGYGLSVVSEGGALRAEGYGKVPAAFAFLGGASIGATRNLAKPMMPEPEAGALLPAAEK